MALTIIIIQLQFFTIDHFKQYGEDLLFKNNVGNDKIRKKSPNLHLF